MRPAFCRGGQGGVAVGDGLAAAVVDHLHRLDLPQWNPRFLADRTGGENGAAQFVDDAGDLAECFFDANYHWDASDEAAIAVREKFAEAFDEEMRTAAVLSYQATYIIADAIERAGSTDPVAVRDALSETSYEDHILPYDGAIEFDETGETIIASPVVMQVQDGSIVQVYPAALQETDEEGNPTEPIFCTSWGS